MLSASGIEAAAGPQLAFAIEGARRVEYAVVPTISFALRAQAPDGDAIRALLLDVQIQIAARRRSYDETAQERLFELFGAAGDWGTTLRTLLWTRVTLVVPPFTAGTVVELPVTCTYDLEVAAARYFDALDDGEVPLEFLFSGTTFYSGRDGLLETARISLEHEAEYRLPVAVWKETMERAFPGTAWLRLRRESLARLAAYKSRNALPTWEAALDALLDGGERPA